MYALGVLLFGMVVLTKMASSLLTHLSSLTKTYVAVL